MLEKVATVCLRPGALQKAGDGNPLQDLESKIIYSLVFYIPLLGNKLQENYENLVVSYNFENMTDSLYLGNHNVYSFCSSSMFLTSYTKKSSTLTTSPQ